MDSFGCLARFYNHDQKKLKSYDANRCGNPRELQVKGEGLTGEIESPVSKFILENQQTFITITTTRRHPDHKERPLAFT